MNRRLPGYFLALFLPSAALIAGAAVLFYRAQAERQLELVPLRESIDTQRGANELRGFVVEYAQDVLFMEHAAASSSSPQVSGPSKRYGRTRTSPRRSARRRQGRVPQGPAAGTNGKSSPSCPRRTSPGCSGRRAT